MKVLELCYGLGGWSKPWLECGHEVTGIDINDLEVRHPNLRFIKADIMDWKPDGYYDIVFASVPCREFCLPLKLLPSNRDERIGLDLVWRAYAIIQEIKPKYWLIENVKGLSEFLGKPHDIVRYGKRKQFKEAYLWGNFPTLGLIPPIKHRHDNFGNSDPRRALIPWQLANAVHDVCCTTIDRNCST